MLEISFRIDLHRTLGSGDTIINQHIQLARPEWTVENIDAYGQSHTGIRHDP